jgi:sRNA-binding regulator protein Hfq
VLLHAEVGACRMPVARLGALRAGEVLRLQAKADQGVRLLADRVALAYGTPGRSGSYKAVKLTGPVSPAPARGGRISHEDERLNAMRRSGRPVEAVCFDDLRVTGRLVAFDQYALILEADGQEIVLFKHGVIMVRCAESGLEDRGATSRGRRERAEAAKPDR